MGRFARLFATALVCSAAAAGCEGDERAPVSSTRSTAHEPTLDALRARFSAVLPAASARGSFRLLGTGSAVFSTARGVRVELPSRSSSPVRLRHVASGVGLRSAARLGAEGELRVSDGFAAYARAGEELPLVAYRAAEDGVEDYVVVRAAGDRKVAYDLDLENVAGLRLVAGVLELLDASGTPRLRVTASSVVDSLGQRRPVELRLDEQCARDVDPRAPWGRAVVAPGHSRCRLDVGWDASGLVYPVVLDPYWSATGDMTAASYRPTATPLSDGRVLVAGGYGAGALASSELFDPTTDTWAATGTMTHGRQYHRASRLSDGRVLVTGAFSTYSKTAEIYDPAAGTWSATGSMTYGRNSHTQTTLPSGKVIVAGDGTAAELFDPASGTFGPAGTNVGNRTDGVAVLLDTGKVLLAGGYVAGGFDEKICELYDPASNSWSQTGLLLAAREYIYGLKLGDGRVLVAGGYGPIPNGTSYEVLNSAEIYDPSSATWSATASMAFPRTELTLSTLPNGAVLAYGGYDFNNTFDYTEIYDPTAAAWTTLPPAPMARFGHVAAELSDGRVVVAGGADTGPSVKTSHVFGLNKAGEACTLTVECATGHCVDGVCCDTACNGVCSACTSAKKGGGSDGVCGVIAAGSDPDDECPALTASTCGSIGTCDGAGACALHPSGTVCGPPSCTGGTLETSLCNGTGSCIKTQSSCAPYVCADATSCHASCNDSAQCESGAFCDATAHQCKSSSPNGTACQSGSQCKSGFCTDGVCCDSACDGICESCTAATNGGTDGTCGFALAGQDPHDTCPDEGVASCKKDGACDGSGACRVYASGTACGPTQCVKSAQVGYACNGSGACLAGSSVTCAPFACASGACKTSCATDDDCDAASYCDSGACIARKSNGTTCSLKGECLTNLCVDGVCCNAPCAGQCESCATPGAPGTCLPVEGSPMGGRPACDSGAGPCEQKKCNGVDRETCASFVGAEVVCQPAACKDGKETPEATCDGTGACPTAAPKPCSPYACGADACETSCSADADCAVGARCDVASGKCASSGTCTDERTLVIAGQAPVDCAPYRCADGSCGASCTSVADCIAGHVCGASGTCVPSSASAPSSSDSGCGCRLAPRDAPPTAPVLLLLMALGFRRRRRNGSA